VKNQKLGFIGIGNMASAIIGGILKSQFISPDQICMYNPHPEKMQRFVESGCIACSSSAEIIQSCGTVFLCIKPQIFPQVLSELKPIADSLDESAVLFVSIAAGVTFKNLQDVLGLNRPYIRVMPNTPLLLGEGASAVSRTENVTDEEFGRICDIFSCCGAVKEIPEDQMNAIISVSGSSPAYLYRLAKVTCDYAEQRGIDRQTALELFCQTLKGSAEMLLHAERSPQELIDMVTSKGGTTFRLLGVLDNRDFDSMMMDAFDACEKRAKELSM
jgi:pyrroline-5-carboxylate reductase